MLCRGAVSGPDTLAPLHPSTEIGKACTRQLLLQHIQEVVQVGGNSKVRSIGGLVQLGGVDIHLGHPGMLGEGLPVVAGLANVQARAEHEHEIGRLQAQVARPRADGARSPRKQRMVGSDQVMRPGRGQRYTVTLDQR